MDKLVLNCHFRIWISLCLSGGMCDSCCLLQVLQSHLQVSLKYDRKDSKIDGLWCWVWECPSVWISVCFICAHVKPLALTQLLKVINHIHHCVSIYVYHVPCNTLSLSRSGTFLMPLYIYDHLVGTLRALACQKSQANGAAWYRILSPSPPLPHPPL